MTSTPHIVCSESSDEFTEASLRNNFEKAFNFQIYIIQKYDTHKAIWFQIISVRDIVGFQFGLCIEGSPGNVLHVNNLISAQKRGRETDDSDNKFR